MALDTTTTDVWAAGAFAARYGAAYLSVTEPTFRTIARQEKWPRKRVLGKVVYPRSLVVAFLAACPAADDLAPAKAQQRSPR